jgi:hypothetical protein
MPSEKEIEGQITNIATAVINSAVGEEKWLRKLAHAYLSMKSERDSILGQLRDMTPGGSEYQSADECLDFIRTRLASRVKDKIERDKYKEIVEKDTEVIDAILKHDGLDRISIRNFHTSDCSILSGFTNRSRECNCFYRGIREALSLRDKKE